MTPPVSGCSLPLGERHIPAAGPPQGTTSSSAGHGQRLSHPSPAAAGHAPPGCSALSRSSLTGCLCLPWPRRSCGLSREAPAGLGKLLAGWWRERRRGGRGARCGPARARSEPLETLEHARKHSEPLGSARADATPAGSGPLGTARAGSELLGVARNRSESLGHARSRSAGLGPSRFRCGRCRCRRRRLRPPLSGAAPGPGAAARKGRPGGERIWGKGGAPG